MSHNFNTFNLTGNDYSIPYSIGTAFRLYQIILDYNSCFFPFVGYT